jgi:hypothetical protein
MEQMSNSEFSEWFKTSFDAFDYYELKECIIWAVGNPEYPYTDIPPGETTFSNSEIHAYLRNICDKLKLQ